MFSKVFFALAVACLSVSAQKSSNATNSTTTTSASAANSTSTPSTAGISPCVLECVSGAATLDGCVSFANLTCVCSSAQFQADAQACLTTNCSPTDLQEALQLQTTECSSAGISVSGTATTTNTVPFSGAANSTQTTGASSGTGSAGTVTTSSSPATGTPTSPATGGSASPSPTQTGAASGMAVKHGAAALVGAVIACALAL